MDRLRPLRWAEIARSEGTGPVHIKSPEAASATSGRISVFKRRKNRGREEEEGRTSTITESLRRF
jgi:hypothetical protein